MAKEKRPGGRRPASESNPQSKNAGRATTWTTRSSEHRPSSTDFRESGGGFFTNVRLQSLLIGALAFLLYANTLTHGFTLDDSIVISENMFTKQGVKGIPGLLGNDTFYGFFKVEGKEALVAGGRYRPLTPVLFALVYQVFGENTFVFHLLTVLLYALTCMLLYRVLVRLFTPRFGEDHAALLAWLAALLFTVHPIHTEVVANIKGCDELATLLLCLGALHLVLLAYDTGKTSPAWLAGLVYFLACLSKENAAAFAVVIPLAIVFFRGSAATAPTAPAPPTPP